MDHITFVSSLPSELPDKRISSKSTTKDLTTSSPNVQLNHILKKIQPMYISGMAKRRDIIKKLSFILELWAKTVVYQLGFNNDVVSQKHLKLYPFGSFSFQDSSQEADLDILCVTSCYITRSHFFCDLRRLFESMRKEVQDFLVISSAYIPLIKMKYLGVNVDLCFAQLHHGSIPSSLNLRDLSFLQYIDDKSFASIGGYRITEAIIKAVPHFENFCETLRIIKQWAKGRLIYSALFGFLGGSSWSLLTALICQQNPNENPSNLVCRFFEYYATWDWRKPIILSPHPLPVSRPSPPPSSPSSPAVKGHSKSKRNRNPSSSSSPSLPPSSPSSPAVSNVQVEATATTTTTDEAMQIMTPIIPSTNSSYSVCKSTLSILVEEFKRAHHILSLIQDETIAWRQLFLYSNDEIFTRYPLYLQITIQTFPTTTTTTTTTTQQPTNEMIESRHAKWEGWCKSRVPSIVKLLEQEKYIRLAHPHISCSSSPSPSSEDKKEKEGGKQVDMEEVLPAPLSDLVMVSLLPTTDDIFSSSKRPKILHDTNINNSNKTTTMSTKIIIGMRLEDAEMNTIDNTTILSCEQKIKSFVCTWREYDVEKYGLLVDCLHRSDLPSFISEKTQFP